MGAPKRKRQSMDSAIADMSSEDSFSTQMDTQTSDYSTPLTQQEDAANPSQAKRRRSSCITAPLGFDARDFGTAASQRPRRGAASQTSTSSQMTTLHNPPQQRRSKRAVVDQCDGTPTADTSLMLHLLSRLPPACRLHCQLPVHEMNGSFAEREQTPEQAAAELPTPPQTLEKTNSQTAPQSLRRSTRERRPTERAQHASAEESTPCGKRPKASAVRVTEDQGENVPATRDRKSCIVRLRVPSASISQDPSQSMSFTGSFSHRQKCGDSQVSQTSQRQVSRRSG